MFETFADNDRAEEFINNDADVLAADDPLVETLADRSESVLEGPIEVTPFLQKFEAFADQVCSDDPSEAELETVRSTIMSSVNSEFTNINVHDIAEFREYIRSYDDWDDYDDVSNLQDAMEDDDEFSMFTTLQGEVVYMVEETHNSVAARIILDDGTDAEDDGVRVTIWTQDNGNDLTTVACKPEDVDRFDNDPVTIETGDTIAIDGFAADLYENDEGVVEINVDSTSAAEVIEIDREFDLGGSVEEVELEGTITGLRNSGDILYKDSETGERDLRIKAWLTPENGDDQKAIVIHDTEQVEDILGMSLEEAEELALESLGEDGGELDIAAAKGVLNERVDVTALHYQNDGGQADTYAVSDINFVDAESRVEAAVADAPADD